jgi:hypothetical protein
LAAAQAPILLRQAARLRSQLAEARLAAQQIEERRMRGEAERSAKAAELEACRRECLGLAGRPELDRVLAEVRGALATARTREDAARTAVRQLREGLLRDCRLLATTAFRSSLGQIPDRRFDAVAMDEASTLLLPLAYSVAGLARSKVVVAGDFRQLGPIAGGQTPACLRWVRRSPFEAAGIPARLEAGTPPANLVMLRCQYRMRPQICEIVSGVFYGGELWTDPSVQARPVPSLGAGENALFWVDSGPFFPWIGRPMTGSSRYNLVHVGLITQVVRALAAEGRLRAAGGALSLGVVSPYAAQSHLLYSALQGLLAPSDASTVHRLQGAERDIVLLDLTDAPGAAVGPFFQPGNPDGDRLLNVAVSRARHYLVVVADFAFLRRPQAVSDRLLNLLDQVQCDGRPWPVDDPLPAGVGTASPAVAEAGTTRWFRESGALPAVRQDVQGARRSVLVAAPYTTERGVGRWLADFDAVRRRGVRVRVLTRPPDENTREWQARLRAAGCEIELRPGMHEKIVIVDGRVLWEGSLNLLSHRNTTEVMRRSENSAYCDQVELLLYGRGGAQQAGPAPPCPVCGGMQERMAVVEGARRRLIDRCAAGCAPAARRDRAGLPCPAAGCPGRLTLRHGTAGEFLGCTAYPRCRHTEPIASSAGAPAERPVQRSPRLRSGA